MIVDVHTRLWESTEQLGKLGEKMLRRKNQPWDRPTTSSEEHAAAMKPVAAAFVLGYRSRLLEASISHERIAEYTAQQPERLIGFAGIDPTEEKPLESLERAIELGLAGVILSPASQGFHPADTRAMQIYEACQAQKMPVIFESGAAAARLCRMEFAQPYLLDEVLRHFPELRVLLDSLGLPFIEQGLTLLAKHPNLYASLAEQITQPWALYNTLVLAHQQRLINQLLFGSNYPLCSPEKAIVTIYSVNTFVQGTHLPSVPREQLRSIVERDALTCLGLTPPLNADTPQRLTDTQHDNPATPHRSTTELPHTARHDEH